ncbi:MAG: hypothetical protein NTY45_11220 [Elusimicrobia bacterium]|nr:hypothetical protein [Elusimicrobiota bacterium]
MPPSRARFFSRSRTLSCLAILLAGSLPAGAAVPVYKWFPSNEFYFAAPLAQNLHYPGGTARAAAWAFGFRAVSNGEGVGKTGAFQIQHLTVNNKTAGVNGSFYLLELLAGAEYISPAAQNQPMRFTAAALANLGLSDTTLYMAPMLTAGLLYQTNPAEQIPNGFSLTLYYRLTDIHLDNAAGKPAALRPAAGLRLGYIFPGFWTQK